MEENKLPGHKQPWYRTRNSVVAGKTIRERYRTWWNNVVALLYALAIFLMSEPFHTSDKAEVSRVMWHEFTTSVFVILPYWNELFYVHEEIVCYPQIKLPSNWEWKVWFNVLHLNLIINCLTLYLRNSTLIVARTILYWKIFILIKLRTTIT